MKKYCLNKNEESFIKSLLRMYLYNNLVIKNCSISNVLIKFNVEHGFSEDGRFYLIG